MKGAAMDVMEAIRNRRSVRSYAPKPIPGDVMERMKDALRLAPSAKNGQPWKFVLVTTPEAKSALVPAAKGQKFIAEAPVIVVGVGFPDQAYTAMGGDGNSVDVDLAIALDHLTLAAAAEGLGTCWIGAFIEDEVRTIIGAPAGSRIVAMTPLGYPKTPELIHPVADSRRKRPEEVFCYERYA
jgi:nitroreductase